MRKRQRPLELQRPFRPRLYRIEGGDRCRAGDEDIISRRAANGNSRRRWERLRDFVYPACRNDDRRTGARTEGFSRREGVGAERRNGAGVDLVNSPYAVRWRVGIGRWREDE